MYDMSHSCWVDRSAHPPEGAPYPYDEQRGAKSTWPARQEVTRPLAALLEQCRCSMSARSPAEALAANNSPSPWLAVFLQRAELSRWRSTAGVTLASFYRPFIKALLVFPLNHCYQSLDHGRIGQNLEVAGRLKRGAERRHAIARP